MLPVSTGKGGRKEWSKSLHFTKTQRLRNWEGNSCLKSWAENHTQKECLKASFPPDPLPHLTPPDNNCWSELRNTWLSYFCIHKILKLLHGRQGLDSFWRENGRNLGLPRASLLSWENYHHSSRKEEESGKKEKAEEKLETLWRRKATLLQENQTWTPRLRK